MAVNIVLKSSKQAAINKQMQQNIGSTVDKIIQAEVTAETPNVYPIWYPGDVLTSKKGNRTLYGRIQDCDE